MIRNVVVLAALAVCTYLPALRLPFSSDEYYEIPLARQYAAQHWKPLWHDARFRTRATYMLLDGTLDQLFGFHPLPFYVASIVLHALCVLIVYGVLGQIDKVIALFGAAFFAIYEGHQEAVMWPAAAHDLLVFLFGMACCFCWLKWLAGSGIKWYVAALAAFLAGCASKESIWIVPFLMMLLAWLISARHRPTIGGLAPFFAIAAAYVLWTYVSLVQAQAPDIRFSLTSPWPLVILKSFWRLMFIWGLVALAVFAWFGKKEDGPHFLIGSLWMIFGLIPYSFLTYMQQVPSRQTYIASFGVALLVGTAAYRLRQENRRVVLAALSIAALVLNIELIWVKKMAQYRERAEPARLLTQAAADAAGPLYVECTPLDPFTARFVVEDAGGHAIFRDSAGRHNAQCFEVEYTNREGKMVRLNQQIESKRHGALQ